MAGAGGAVEGVDGSVFIGGQGEAEQVEILLLTVSMHGLGDDDRAVFDVLRLILSLFDRKNH